MHKFRVVCFLTASFLLVVCVSASAQVSKTDATTAVTAAKAAVTAVRLKAQNALNDAQSLLDKVESAKSKAEAAASKSQTAATDNKEAVGIAETIKSLSDAVAASYLAVQQKLDTAVKSLTLLLDKAKKLEAEPEITITPNEEDGDDYTVTKGKATTLEGQAGELDGQIDAAVKPIDGVDTTVNDMVKKAKEAQLKDAHVSVVVAVAKIKTVIGNADRSIEKIQSKKSDVNGVVQEIKTHCKKDPIESNETLKKKCNSAADLLTSATGAVEEAKNAKTKIEQQKGHADTALTNVQKKETDVTTAKQEADKAKACGTTADDIFPELNTALRNAETSLKTANGLKQEIDTALSKATSDLSNTQSKETAQSNSPVGQSTEPDQKDTTIQPTSKELPEQSDNSEDKLKNTLIKGAQNVPTTTLTGEKAPAPGAKNDSAMTVSVPLLVALIASAVLQ